jgi:hypothetical protein
MRHLLGLDHRRASFDKLRMRTGFHATKVIPHPEPVEGRILVVQAIIGLAGRAGKSLRTLVPLGTLPPLHARL